MRLYRNSHLVLLVDLGRDVIDAFIGMQLLNAVEWINICFAGRRQSAMSIDSVARVLCVLCVFELAFLKYNF